MYRKSDTVDNMIKKFLTLTLLLTSSINALPYNIYGGVQGALSELNGKSSSNMKIESQTDSIQNNYDYNYHSRKGNVYFMVGTSCQYKNFVTALELEYTPNPNFSSHINHKNGFSFERQLKGKQAHNVGIKVGYYFSPLMNIYVKGIVEKRKFEENFSHKEDIFNVNHTTSFTKNGLGTAIGLEYTLDKAWSLHTEFRNVGYKIAHSEASFPLPGNVIETHFSKNKININSLMIGLKYRFV